VSFTGSGPTFTQVESQTNRSYYSYTAGDHSGNYYDYTVSAPFTFEIGGMNANAKEAIENNF